MKELLMLLELIESSVELAPAISELVRKARAGEPVTIEEINQARAIVKNAADEWANA